MAITQLTTRQLGTNSVNNDDLDITTTGKAVVIKLAAGTNISLGSTGVDAGTGVVTVNSSSPEVTQVNLTPVNDVTILAGYSSVFVRKIVISNGRKIILQSSSILRIL